MVYGFPVLSVSGPSERLGREAMHAQAAFGGESASDVIRATACRPGCRVVCNGRASLRNAGDTLADGCTISPCTQKLWIAVLISEQARWPNFFSSSDKQFSKRLCWGAIRTHGTTER